MEKKTRRTYQAYYPWEDGIALCFATGNKKIIDCGKSGYSEYNDRGQPVLDSWIDQPFYVILK